MSDNPHQNPNAGVTSRAQPPSPVASGRTLIKGGTVLTMDPTLGDFATGDVLIENGNIVLVAADISAPEAAVIDAAGRIVMPGFADPHIHCWEGALGRLLPTNVAQTRTDGVVDAPSSSRSYMHAAHKLFGPACRPEDIYAGTLMTLLTALDGGITTVVDNMHNARTPEHSDASVQALLDSGVRGVHATGAPRSGDWAGTFPADARRLKSEYFSSAGQLCSMRLFAAGFDDIDDLFDIRKELDVWFSFDSGIERHDVPSLYANGSLDGREAINHANFLSSVQRQAVIDSGAQVNVCPRIETQFRYGHVPYQEWAAQGLRPGISNDNPMTFGVDMFNEMRALYLTLKLDEHRGGPVGATQREVLYSATQAGASNAGLGSVTGSLSPGKRADVVLLDSNRFQLFPVNNVVCTVVQAADIGCVDTVIVDGRIKKWAGALVGVDLRRVRSLVEESNDYLRNVTAWPHAAIDFED